MIERKPNHLKVFESISGACKLWINTFSKILQLLSAMYIFFCLQFWIFAETCEKNFSPSPGFIFFANIEVSSQKIKNLIENFIWKVISFPFVMFERWMRREKGRDRKRREIRPHRRKDTKGWRQKEAPPPRYFETMEDEQCVRESDKEKRFLFNRKFKSSRGFSFYYGITYNILLLWY